MAIFNNNTEEYIRKQVLEREKVYKAQKRTILVEGVGINDSDGMTSCWYVNLEGKKTKWFCPVYRVWQSMLNRCYNASFLEKNLTYNGCSVHSDWHSFMNFKKWMLTQDWQGNHLDKDLLVPGNKEYSADTCVFLPRHINLFMCDAGAIRGECSLGVMKTARHANSSKPYTARITNTRAGITEWLGRYATDAEAHSAWKKRKHELAVELSKTVTDPRIINALITRYI